MKSAAIRPALVGVVLVCLRRCVSGLILALACFGVAGEGLAVQTNEESLEYSVKGAFLYKFGAFVEWPPTAFSTANAPLVIGVIGDDPFGPRLDQIVASHTVEGRPVVVVRTRQVEQARDAHILYISQSEKDRLGAILAGLQGKTVLTVADFENPNIVITFVVDSNKVRFEVNLAQADRTGLKLSSRLLSVAKSVKGR